MKLQTFETYSSITDRDLKDKTVVVIDTLRATSVITVALYNGAKEVIPVAEIEEAMELARNFEKGGYLLGGERNAIKIEGFDLANSPLEYTREAVERKTIILATTNGTRALKKVSSADNIIIGCLLNVSSVAKYIFEQNQDAVIVCSGTEGKFSLEDIVTAGAIYGKLKKLTEFESDDLSKASYFLYKPYEDNLHDIIKHGYHPKKLYELGFEKDINFCITADMYNIIPKYKNGVVRIAADL